MENTFASFKEKTHDFVENIFDTLNTVLAPAISKKISREFTVDLDTGNISNTMSNSATLLVYVNSTDEKLVEIYNEHIKKHNKNIATDEFPNSGFDLFIPNEVTLKSLPDSTFIDLGIKCEMIYNDVANKKSSNCGFYVFPRSSISKTPLMLSNHTGIIDSGYRGFLIGAFRNLSDTPYVVEKHTRLLQICHPSLCPIVVKLVSENDLSRTLRQDGGFGSTGSVGITI